MRLPKKDKSSYPRYSTNILIIHSFNCAGYPCPLPAIIPRIGLHNPLTKPHSTCLSVCRSPSRGFDGQEADHYSVRDIRQFLRPTEQHQTHSTAVLGVFFEKAARTRNSKSENRISAGRFGVSRPSRVISMMRQAMTMLMAMARRSRSAVS